MQRKSIKGWRCTKCKELKPTYEFKEIARRIGEDPKPKVCKACLLGAPKSSVVKQKPPSKKQRAPRKIVDMRAYMAAYYQANKERARLNNKRWAAENSEKVARKNREWKESNPEKIRETRRKYRERERELKRKWRKAHPEKVKADDIRRRARLLNAVGSHSAADLIQMYEDQDGLCAYCETPLFGSYEVDHIVPLARGGSNDAENLAITCPDCNRSKGVKSVEDFMEYLRSR